MAKCTTFGRDNEEYFKLLKFLGGHTLATRRRRREYWGIFNIDEVL
jgi:hypothetical protein